MIFTDLLGYLTNETSDGMDSAMRAGVLAVCKGTPLNLRPIRDYEVYVEVANRRSCGSGTLVRHPTQEPANNPHNFTRDQMMPLVAGFYSRGLIEESRRVLWATLKRFCFAQNTQRDVKGSRKMKRPHSFYKDSRPNTDTLPMKLVNWKWESQLVEFANVVIEKRYFDSSDPLFPSHMAVLIKASGLWFLQPFTIPGRLWLYLELKIMQRKWRGDVELNQLFCMCAVMGTKYLLLFKRIPDWRASFRNYWDSRNESEYADLIIKYLEGV